MQAVRTRDPFALEALRRGGARGRDKSSVCKHLHGLEFWLLVDGFAGPGMGQAMFEEKLFGSSHVRKYLTPPSLRDQHEENIGQNQLCDAGGEGSLKIFHRAGGGIKGDVGGVAQR